MGDWSWEWLRHWSDALGMNMISHFRSFLCVYCTWIFIYLFLVFLFNDILIFKLQSLSTNEVLYSTISSVMLRNNTKTIVWSGFVFHKTKIFDIHIVASCIPFSLLVNKSNIQRGNMPNKRKNSFEIKEKEWEK